MPWCFEKAMEKEYQRHHLCTLLDNAKPFACTVLPIGLSLRLGFLVNHVMRNPECTVMEVIFGVGRICVNLAVFACCFLFSWSENSKITIAKVIIWCGRFVFSVIPLQEAGLRQDQSYLTQIMITLIMLCVTSPAAIPTFE